MPYSNIFVGRGNLAASMRWKDLTINGRKVCMALLQLTVRTFKIGGRGVSVEITFGFHCVKGHKEKRPLMVNPKTKEEQYFCPLQVTAEVLASCEAALVKHAEIREG